MMKALDKIKELLLKLFAPSLVLDLKQRLYKAEYAAQMYKEHARSYKYQRDNISSDKDRDLKWLNGRIEARDEKIKDLEKEVGFFKNHSSPDQVGQIKREQYTEGFKAGIRADR